MIYGDNPNKINEREDALGLKTYTYAPSINSIMQSGNLYVYCGNSPISKIDPTGNTSYAVAWTTSMWWLCAADTVLPFGDILYLVGIGCASVADIISTLGVDNIVMFVSESPNVANNIAENVEKYHEVSSNGGGSSPSPGDPKWGKGFDNFKKLKNYLGSPGEGKEWHHIVDQCQIEKSGFNPNSIHNTNNIINIPKEIHTKISAHYSRIYDYTDGLRLRDWLANKSFQEQYEWGLKVLRLYGVEI